MRKIDELMNFAQLPSSVHTYILKTHVFMHISIPQAGLHISTHKFCTNYHPLYIHTYLEHMYASMFPYLGWVFVYQLICINFVKMFQAPAGCVKIEQTKSCHEDEEAHLYVCMCYTPVYMYVCVKIEQTRR
jgi:hypothetical protein